VRRVRARQHRTTVGCVGWEPPRRGASRGASGDGLTYELQSVWTATRETAHGGSFAARALRSALEGR
jgi:hypothetical protein